MILDSPTGPYVHSENVPVDPLEQFIDFRELAAVYEPVAQPNDLVNDYNGPVCLSCQIHEGVYIDFGSAVV